jgi:hypothetical protein
MKLSSEMMKEWRSLKRLWASKAKKLRSVESIGEPNYGKRVHPAKKRDNQSSSISSISAEVERHLGRTDRKNPGSINKTKDDNNAGSNAENG